MLFMKKVKKYLAEGFINKSDTDRIGVRRKDKIEQEYDGEWVKLKDVARKINNKSNPLQYPQYFISTDFQSDWRYGLALIYSVDMKNWIARASLSKRNGELSVRSFYVTPDTPVFVIDRED